MNGIDQLDAPSADTGIASSQVADVLAAYQEALRAGRSVDRRRLLAENPDVAEELSECLDALELIHSVADDVTQDHRSGIEPSPLESGSALGDFRILREIGHGGMGVVYEAEQAGLTGRRVALKVLTTAASLDARAVERFRIEAQTAACLNHPNIVPVFAVGRERGIPFYAMPFIPGSTLAEILHSVRTTHDAPVFADVRSGAKSWPRAVAHLGRQAAAALEHAHSLGVIHRDIKPSNLIVDGTGHLWITDFGLARLARGDADLTQTGDLVGTVRYMSPEQIRGEPSASDRRVDLYSLGVTLYEALTLRPAFDGNDRSALLHRILHDEPPAPRLIDPSVPKDLETIVLKAMDKVPACRYATAQELAEDLDRYLADQPVLAERLSAWERARRWSRKHRAWLSAAVAGVALSMAIGALSLWRAKREAEVSLAKISNARVQERTAIEKIFRFNDGITVPMIDEATKNESDDRRREAYKQLIGFYDGIVRSYSIDDHQIEVVARASRRAGALRLAVGLHEGFDNYAHAAEVYEALIVRVPAALWYRTDLMTTLRELASRLDEARDHNGAAARRKRAYEVADGLLAEKNARLHCFRIGLVPELRAWVKLLSEKANASDRERALAARMSAWLAENPLDPARF
jgi:serine/threonine protein kinase